MDASAPPRQPQRGFCALLWVFWGTTVADLVNTQPFFALMPATGCISLCAGTEQLLSSPTFEAALLLKQCEQKGMRLLCFSG